MKRLLPLVCVLVCCGAPDAPPTPTAPYVPYEDTQRAAIRCGKVRHKNWIEYTKCLHRKVR